MRAAASPRWVLAVAFVIVAASALLTLRLRISTDISVLLPEHSRVSAALLQALEDFGATDRLIVIVESRGEGDVITNRRALKELAGEIAASMEQTGLFSAVTYRITSEQREFFEELYFNYPFHYHSPEELRALESKLSPGKIERRVAGLARELRLSPFSASSRGQLLRDPLGLRSDLRAGYSHDNLAGFDLDLSDGHFFSTDGSCIMIVAEPRLPSQDTAFDAELLAALERILTGLGGAGTIMPDYSMELGNDLAVHALGPYVETLYGSQAARKEILPSFALTCLGLLILFAVVYRSIKTLILLAVPLLTGIAVTCGMASLFAGHLTVITVGFAAMLAGLGVDFGIHLLDRIRQESGAGGEIREAIARAFATTGRGVLAGALTSAAIFLLIATSDFAALREFGWIIGLGILSTLISMIFLLPALIVPFKRWRSFHRPGARMAWGSVVVSRYRLVCLAGLAVTLLLGYSASQLRLESNIYELGPMNAVYEEEKDRILRKLEGSTNIVMAVAERKELQDLLELSERMQASLEQLESAAEIDSFESLGSLLPSRASQLEAVETVREWDLEEAMAAFERSLEKAGFRTAQFHPFIDNVLAYGADGDMYVELEDLKGTPAEQMLDRFLFRREESWKSVTYIYPRSGRWEEEIPPAIVEEIEGLGEGIVLTGIVPSFKEIATSVRGEFLKLTLSALIVVLLISLIFFRKPLLSLMAAIPAAVGLIWTLGLMKLAGIELNLITILVAPMIVGLGIDDALHVLNRYRENAGDLPATLRSVSGAILMTSATTVIGFGSLSFADLPSLSSLGITVSIGMVCCALSSLVLLPALLTAFGSPRQ
jgi:predicted RND superfamily exporter protein